MAEESFWIIVRAQIRDFQKKWKTITSEVTGFGARMRRLSAEFGGELQTVGTQTTLITLLITAAFAKAIHGFAKFEQSIHNAASVTKDGIAAVSAFGFTARSAAMRTGVSANEAGKALYYLASAGFSTMEAVSALSGVLKLAAATQTNIAFTSEAVATAIKGFGLEASQATRVANVYASVISQSQATMNKLANSMRYIAPAAHTAGYSLEEVTAALGILYDAGLQGSQSGTGLRTAILRLVNPANAARDAMREMGLSAEDLSPQFNSLATIIKRLEDGNLSLARATKIFGVRSAVQMLALVNAGSEAYKKLRREITSTTKATEMMHIQLGTVSGSMKLMKTAMEDASFSFAKNFVPQLMDSARGLAELFKASSVMYGKMGELGARVTQAGLTFAGLFGIITLGVARLKDVTKTLAGFGIALSTLGVYALIATAAITAVGLALENMGKRSRQAHERLDTYASLLMATRDAVVLWEDQLRRIEDSHESEAKKEERRIQITRDMLDAVTELTDAEKDSLATSELQTRVYMQMLVAERESVVMSQKMIQTTKDRLAIDEAALTRYKAIQKTTREEIAKTAAAYDMSVEGAIEKGRMGTRYARWTEWMRRRARDIVAPKMDPSDFAALVDLVLELDKAEENIGRLKAAVMEANITLRESGLETDSLEEKTAKLRRQQELQIAAMEESINVTRRRKSAIEKVLDTLRRYSELTEADKLAMDIENVRREFQNLVDEVSEDRSAGTRVRILKEGWNTMFPVELAGQRKMMSLLEIFAAIKEGLEIKVNEESIKRQLAYEQAVLALKAMFVEAHIGLIDDEHRREEASIRAQFAGRRAAVMRAYNALLTEHKAFNEETKKLLQDALDAVKAYSQAENREITAYRKETAKQRLSSVESMLGGELSLMEQMYKRMIETGQLSGQMMVAAQERLREISLRKTIEFFLEFRRINVDFINQMRDILSTSIVDVLFGGEAKEQRVEQEREYVEELKFIEEDLEKARRKGEEREVAALERRRRRVNRQLEALRRSFLDRIKLMAKDVLEAWVNLFLKEMMSRLVEYLDKMILIAMEKMGILKGVFESASGGLAETATGGLFKILGSIFGALFASATGGASAVIPAALMPEGLGIMNWFPPLNSAGAETLLNSAAPPAAMPVNVVFSETIDLRGTVPMADSDEFWQEVYERRILPARTRHVKTLKRVINEEIL